MGIFNKINQRSGLVVGAITIGLLLFLLGNEFFGPNSILFRNKNNVGEINGSSVHIEEYQNTVARQEAEYQIQSDKGVTEGEKSYIQQQSWSKLIYKYIYQDQFEKLGLVITDDEKFDMVQGSFIHSYIKNAFGGNEQFDKSLVVNFLQNFDKVDPSFQQKWYVIESQLDEVRLREKYNNLLKKSEYVTKAEAKRIYHAQTDKANVDYVFVPFTTIADSTIEVTDADLNDYISKHKDEYKVEAGRSIVYAVFDAAPTAKDSATVRTEIQKLQEDFKTTDKDSLFIQNNSDVETMPSYMTVAQLPAALSENVNALEVGAVYGPVSDAGNYSLYKILKVESDTVYSMRAAHILFRAEQETPEGKAEAKKKAQDILAQIKGGANFAEMAKQYGSDGTSSRGGDLGWFGKGQMVKPFEEACFGASKAGLLPSIVETDFGYHIISITNPKTNKKFLVGSVVYNISSSDETRDSIYARADEFAATVKDTAQLNAEVLKLSVKGNVQKYSQENIGANDPALSAVQKSREIIRWAFNDADLGDVSQVFTVENKFVIAILTGSRDKGTATANDVREEVKRKVLNEKKGVLIAEKLEKVKSGAFADIAKAYGADALTGTATDITLASAVLASVGYDPQLAGLAFGLKQGAQSKVVVGDNGVCILKLATITVAPDIADYNTYATQAVTAKTNRVEYMAEEALKKYGDIEDNRYKFY
jgi:peptidyl-prolyl cis-trans isomerase D